MQTNVLANGKPVVCSRNRGRDGVDVKYKRNLFGMIEISWWGDDLWAYSTVKTH